MKLHFLGILAGKITYRLLRVLRRQGSALPGYVAERISPSLPAHMLHSLPKGVLLISGTNGKTTTTKITAELVARHNLRVFTNTSGSNFSRGITAEALRIASLSGKLNADIGILEIDEAHGALFTKMFSPQYVMLLNVSPDQEDRFKDVGPVEDLLQSIARAATTAVIINQDDATTAAIGKSIQPPVKIRSFTMEDTASATVVAQKQAHGKITFHIEGQPYSAVTSLRENYNIQNITAAVTAAQAILGDSFDFSIVAERLPSLSPAKGRGEVIHLPNGRTATLCLIKNQASFKANLDEQTVAGKDIVIAINNNFADGKDISWLKKVDYSALKDTAVHTMSGSCAKEAADYIAQQGVTIDHINTSPSNAISALLDSSQKDCIIFMSYTALQPIRATILKRAHT